MTLAGWAQIIVFCAIILLLARPLGGYLTRVFAGERTVLSTLLNPVERVFYAIAGIDPKADQRWTAYAASMLAFNLAGFLVLYAILRLQGVLPLNPQGMAGMPPDLALNTAASFVTNTNWQSYGGESTLGYFAQMAGLTVQNFVSAATGIALAVVMIRGFARRSTEGLGNFWADLTRCTLYILLPICIVLAIFLVWQGVPQNLDGYVETVTLEGGKQTIAQGPVASQVAIKMLGTNGGGFFNANAAHPYENPTPLSNFVQMLSIFVLGAALTNVFGRMVGNERQGWAILGAMGVLFVVGVAALY
jgi:K+-transporting ATPase ATPase A chain